MLVTVNTWLMRNTDWLFFAFAILPLAYLFFAAKKDAMLTWGIGGVFLVLAATMIVMASILREPVPFGTIAGVLTFYCTLLFMLLSEAMRLVLGKFLTRARGEKWTKEMEYVYLTMAAVGVLASVNRAEFLTGRLNISEVLSALLLSTAVVIRFLKTRAEIAGWNKFEFYDKPKTTAAAATPAPGVPPTP